MTLCAAQNLEDGLLSGCEDEAATTVEAVGTLSWNGVHVSIALCQGHLDLVDSGEATAMTVMFKEPA